MEGRVRDQVETVSLELALEYSHVRIARLVASGVGNAAGFDIDELEDLRIAVDEACGLVIEGGAQGRLQLSFETSSTDVTVSISARSDPQNNVPVARLAPGAGLSSEILSAVVDNWEELRDDGRHQVVLRKRRTAGVSQ